MLNFVTYY